MRALWINETFLCSQDGDAIDPALFNKSLPAGSCGYGEITRKQYPFWSIAGINPSNALYSRPMKGCGACIVVQCQERQVRAPARLRRQCANWHPPAAAAALCMCRLCSQKDSSYSQRAVGKR